MRRDGYMAVGRKEEPIFHLVDGEPTYLRQKYNSKRCYGKIPSNSRLNPNVYKCLK